MSESTEAVEQAREAQVTEYTTYVAKEPIHIDGTLAFNVGDPVPVSHVDRKVVSTDQVAKRNTRAGKAATGEES